MRIKVKHPVRERFAGCSSGAKYYDSKGEAADAFDAVLMEYGFYLDHADCIGWSGDEGRVTIAVYADPDGPFELPGGPEHVGYAHFTYYRMESGRWEVIGYLS